MGIAGSCPMESSSAIPAPHCLALPQILNTGYFHCDPHPGNLCTNAQGQLVFYDYGMMAQLKPNVLEGYAMPQPVPLCHIPPGGPQRRLLSRATPLPCQGTPPPPTAVARGQ